MRLYVLVAWLFMFQFVISLLVVCRSHSTEMAERIVLLTMDKHLNDNVPKTKQFDSNENASDRERWKRRTDKKVHTKKKHVDDEEKKSAEIQRSERTMFDVCLSFFDRAYLFTFM